MRRQAADAQADARQREHGREPAVTDRSSATCVPQVVFTVPEVAAVGLNREQAESAGRAVRVVDYGIGDVAGEVPPGRPWHAVPSYPTMSEVRLLLSEAYGL